MQQQQAGPRGLAVLSSIGPMRTLWQQMVRQFRDPRLQQLFARYATYCGSSPWQAPATLMLVAQGRLDLVSQPDELGPPPPGRLRHLMVVHHDDPVNKYGFRMILQPPWWMGPPATRPPR